MCEAFHPTAPEPEGRPVAAVIAAALRHGRVNADEIDHINAHGTATPQNDAAESKGFRRVFGDRTAQLPVTSLKSMIGHCLGAAGAIEAAALALSIARGVIPPTINHESADCDVLVVANQRARAAPARGRVDVVRVWRERRGARDSRLRRLELPAQIASWR